MSLLLQNILGWIVVHKRIIAIVAACIAGLLLLLYLFAVVDSCRFDRAQRQDKEAIANQMAQANAIAANVNADKQLAEQIEANVNVAVKEHLEAVNATDDQRARTDAALERWQDAKTAKEKDVSAEELERLLQELDK